jgi:ribonuclease HI
MALLCHVNIKKELKFLASELQKETLLTFYTDGSVKSIGTTCCLSGYGLIKCQPNTPQVSFKGSTVFFPSSTKSEAMGILSAIIVSPHNCNLNIYTDSASCITTFNTLLHSPIISPRRKLKQNNFLIWDLIFYLIHHKHLLIPLHKVKGHSDNEWNKKADELANAGSHVVHPIVWSTTNFFINKVSV